MGGLWETPHRRLTVVQKVNERLSHPSTVRNEPKENGRACRHYHRQHAIHRLSGSIGFVLLLCMSSLSLSLSSRWGVVVSGGRNGISGVNASPSSSSLNLNAVSIGLRSALKRSPPPSTMIPNNRVFGTPSSSSGSVSASMNPGKGGTFPLRLRRRPNADGRDGTTRTSTSFFTRRIGPTNYDSETNSAPKSSTISTLPSLTGGATPATTTTTKTYTAKPVTRDLLFWENMICGAVSRSIAQVLTHPANTMKTLLQSSRSSPGTVTVRTLLQPQNIRTLTNGAGAQFILSVPHGAINFAVIETVRARLQDFASSPRMTGRGGEGGNGDATKRRNYGPAMDFCSSAIATICCSVVSTPQMMILDNIMAGTYPNLVSAVKGLGSERGLNGFYSGWWPGLAGKIPSYALTWTLFQQLKGFQRRLHKRELTDIENTTLGCLASATTVCIMIPMDTIKTRLVTQLNYPELVAYKGIIDAAVRISKEEGIGAFYRGLTPRLCSVVPMIGIQFGGYEFMKRIVANRGADGGSSLGGGGGMIMVRSVVDDSIDMVRSVFDERRGDKMWSRLGFGTRTEDDLAKVLMEVAADDEQPYPTPQLAPHRNYERNE